MTVLSRVNFVGQIRVDLHHVSAMESFAAEDFRALVTSFVGTDNPYVVRGLEVVSKTGLTAGIKVSDSLVFSPVDQNGSFYLGLADDQDITVDLPADQTNIFVEGKFINQTQNPVNSGIFDPLSTVGEDASGQEFSASVDFQNVMVFEITANTTGFTEGAISLFRASTSASDISEFIDSRPLLFRLGTGGANPNPLNSYDWSNSRSEPVPFGAGVGDAVDSPWRSQDASGSLNDKAFKSFKDWMNAVMTIIKEVSGSSVWYRPPAGASGISIIQVFFDTLGHSLEASKNASFTWERSSGNLVLGGEGTQSFGYNSEYTKGLIAWQSNYTGLRWEIGGEFVDPNLGGKRNYKETDTPGDPTKFLRFESPAVVDGGNVYLYLEREVPKGSGNAVNWGDNGDANVYDNFESVSGLPGDFAGIAIGDYIRKESESYFEYFKVIGMYNGTVYRDSVNAQDQNYIADSTVTTLRLQSATDPTNTNISQSVEALRYFRARYSSNDVVADTSASVYSFQNPNFYWLGRRQGDLFYLRDYGTMQEGEEVTTLDAVYAHGAGGGDSKGGLVIEHAKEAVYDGTAGYSLKGGATTSLVTIRKQKRDNTVEVASGDNSGALLEYSINAPIGTMTVGQNLWVRLSDDTSATLTAGSVTNDVDDRENTDLTTNVYEIRDATDTPVGSFDNIDIHLLARRIDVNGQPALIFQDGSILTEFGAMINTNLDISGEIRVNDYDDTAVPFVADDGSKLLDQDSANFFYNKALQVLGLFNFRFENNNIYQNSPEDVSIMSNLGSHTATLGDANSTFRIPGDLIVDGSTVSANVENVQSEDKLMSLGVGNAAGEAYGGGFELVDNTLTAIQIDSTNTDPSVELTFSAAHGYSLGQIIGVSATDDVGGITAGQIGGQYTIVASATSPGEAEILTTTTLKLYSRGTATATESSATNPPKTFISPWSFRLGGSDGSYTGITSWVFAVRDVVTAPALTPVEDYGTVPTAHTSNMQASRIPFVNDDNAGASGADTTLNFSANFAWDNSTNALSIAGNIIPQTDDTYDLGEDTTPLRWRILHLGSGSDSGIRVGSANLYEDGTDLLKTDDVFQSAEYIKVGRLTEYTETTEMTGPLPLPSGTDLSIFNRDGRFWQTDAGGNQKLLTNEDGNVYEEIVDIVTSPTGNNQAGAIAINDVITLPKDSKFSLANTAQATTDGSTATVTVTVVNHGLTTGDTADFRSTVDIGGIPFGDLTITGATVTVIDSSTISYTATAVSTAAETGFIDSVTAERTRSYIVGSSELEIYDNGVYQIRGLHWEEIGITGTKSNQIRWLKNIDVDDPIHKITYRIDSNGGQVIIIQDSGGTLQGAYEGGATINTLTGVPFTVIGSGTGKAAVFDGDIDVTGVIDPTAITFVPQSSSTVPSGQSGIYISDNASLDLMYVRDGIADINLVQDFLYRDGSKAMTGDLDMGNQKITNLADPTADQEAATKKFTDDTFVKLDGTSPMAATLNMDGNTISGVGSPVDGDDAVNKDYVDQNFLDLDGINPMAGNLDMGTNRINNLQDGVAATDAATVGQVDDIAAGLTDFLKIDGTNAMTAALNAGGFAVTNIATPTGTTDATNKAYVDSPDRYTAVYIDLTNNTGGTVTAGTVVMISQSVAGELILADATMLSTAEGTVGIVVSDILDAASGKVQISGVSTVNTTSLLEPGKTVYLSETSGEATPAVPPATGTVVYSLGVALTTTQVVLNPAFQTINTSIYEEEILAVSGAPADDNQITAPHAANTDITLPLDSRTGDSVKEYVVGAGQLSVKLNGIFLDSSELVEVGVAGTASTVFQVTRSIEVDDIISIKIQPVDSSYIVSSGITTLQNAYNAGSTIAINSGNPLTINGPTAEKLLVINGDIDVTGVIDPKGITFTEEPSVPFGTGLNGLWVDGNGDLNHTKADGSTTTNITQIAAGATPLKLVSTMTNNTGATLTKGTPVIINVSGDIEAVDISNDSSLGTYGLVDSAIIDTQSGGVATHGRVEDVSLTATVGDVLYIKPDGSLIGTSELSVDGAPTEGQDGYSAGDYIIRVGVVAENIADDSRKDIIISVNILGQL